MSRHTPRFPVRVFGDLIVREAAHVANTACDPASETGSLPRPDLWWREASNLIQSLLGKPECSLGSGDNAPGITVVDRQGKLGNGSLRRDASNAGGALLGEPEGATGSLGNPTRPTVGGRQGKQGNDSG